MAERRSLKSLPVGVIPAAVAVIVLGLYVFVRDGRRDNGHLANERGL